MRIQETGTTVDDFAAYGEELTDAELTLVSGGGVSGINYDGCIPKPKHKGVRGVPTTEV